jgi:hypothetical protein
MPCDEGPDTCGCEQLMVDRIRYFTGRHMTARDFRDEQSYHRSFRHLHNRILHGWGIACGLDVRCHSRDECSTKRVVVGCGLAIDCCGREIVVPHDTVSAPMPWDERPTTTSGGQEISDPDAVLLLCLEYCETKTEKVPVLYNPEACCTTQLEPGRVREGYCLEWRWVKKADLGEHGWRSADDCAPPGEDDPCPEPSPCGGGRCCLDPVCPEHPCVPLAVVTRIEEPGCETRIDIDVSGRHTLGQARDQLTHICWINWPHGGVVSEGWLRKQGRLEVRFDHPLEVVKQPDEYAGPRGVNNCTFVVEFGEGFEDLDFVPYTPETPPHLAADRRTAVYPLDQPSGPHLGYRYLINHTVYVTIKCDFLLDACGNPVDGEHVGGRRPTGDGTPGGTFESWFSVVSDGDYDRITKPKAAGA